MTAILERFKEIRQRTEEITKPLAIEDYVVQPIVDVSPPKWHLGHTSWFFETFVLKDHLAGYQVFDPEFNFLFNSYYETVGARTLRTDRGNITRPSVSVVLAYRHHVNQHMIQLLENGIEDDLAAIIELGLQHEQQHQELLYTDIKYILGNNPIFPVYDASSQLIIENRKEESAPDIEIAAGIYEIGHRGQGFCFDNELGVHQVYLHDFQIANQLVTNGEFLEFIDAGGYRNFAHWLAEGWDWVNKNQVKAPEYWHFINQDWHQFTLGGIQKLELHSPVTHLSYYEADAYASWRKKRLPTEFEWEVASAQLKHGERWEWTSSAYSAYPGFKKAKGAIGEYNGKFMINQMVLRGGSCATPPDHLRNTYRNFFHPHLKWQYTGIRMAEPHKL